MEVIVRRAGPDDVPRMLELVRELAIFEREPEAVTVTVEHMADAGFGQKPLWVGWVAEMRSVDRPMNRSAQKVDPLSADRPIDRSADPIMGMAICYERYSTWKGRCLYLEDIVVTSAARGKGVGEKLFKACAAYALERGHHHMLWQVLDWNVDAILFYERFGAEFSREWLNGRLNKDRLRRLLS